jgi:hypothetical protein
MTWPILWFAQADASLPGSVAALRYATPRSWTSLAPWVRASSGAISASNPAIWRFRAASVPSMAARVAGLPAVAAGWAGSAELARVISRLARGRASRQR